MRVRGDTLASGATFAGGRQRSGSTLEGMPDRTVTVTISEDMPSADGSWAAVDTWGRRVLVTLRSDGSAPRTLRRGQAVRGVLIGDRVVDAGL